MSRNFISVIQICDSSKSKSVWTSRNVECDDSDPCTYNDFCQTDGLCEGVLLSCNLPCESCDGTNVCQVEGCVIDGACGCLVDGECYADGAENPANQCQFCHTGNSRTAWTDYADGKECNDSDPCTRDDACHFQIQSAVCSGTDFSSEAACTEVSPCVKETYCDGTECRPVYYASDRQCYANADKCDYPDLYCSGNHAECRYCVDEGACTSVTPANSPKPVRGVDLRYATTFVYKTGTSEYLDVVYAPNGKGYLMLTSASTIRIRFQNYTVPCDDVAFHWQIVRTADDVVVYSQVDEAGSDGTLDVEAVDQLSLDNGAVYRIVVDVRNVRNVSSVDESNNVLVDVTAPLMGDVYDGSAVEGDRDYQTSTTTITAHWDPDALVDDESGMNTSSYEMAVGTTAGGTDVSDYGYSDVSSATVNSLNLVDGVTYYVTLKVSNLAGLVSTGSSDGVTVDVTEPVPGTLTIVASTTDPSQIDYIVNRTSQIVAYLSDCQDPESGILETKYRVCVRKVTESTDTTCNDDRVYTCSDSLSCFMDIELDVYEDNEILDDDVLISGYYYTVVLQVTNGAGAVVTLSSNAVLVDYSSPTVGTVLDGTSDPEADFQADNASLHSRWSGIKDEQSALDYCQLAVFKNFGFADEQIVSPFEVVPTEGETTVTNLVLYTGTRYYSVVKCYNKAGLFSLSSSDGVLIDAFPPTPTEIKDIRYEEKLADVNTDSDFQTSLDGIKTKWKVFSAASGLDVCSWSLNDGDWKDIPPYNATHVLTMQLSVGDLYVAAVQCTSFSGLTTMVKSDGITADSTAPFAGTVIDLCPDFCGVDDDVSYTSSVDVLRFRWHNFGDAESGIASYAWNYDEACDGFFLLPGFRNIPDGQTEAVGNVTLVQNTVYCVTVRATNRAGMTIDAHSNGILVDHTPPDEVAAMDGTSPTTDIDSQTDSTSITFTWSLITDAESYILELQVGLGTVPNDCDVVPMTPVGNVTTAYTFDNLDLVVGLVYFSKVCATNGARLKTCVHTDGILIDDPPPIDDTGVEIGFVPPPIYYQANETHLSAYWYKYPASVDVGHFAMGIGTSYESSDVMDFVGVGANVSHGANVFLDTGIPYYALVKFFDSSGEELDTRSSYGVVVDVTPPIVPATSVQFRFSDETIIEARWDDFVETETFVRYYKWAVGTTLCGAEVHTYTNVGLQKTATRQVEFVSGITYYVAVAALNAAGLTSKACSDGVLYDDSPPVAGSVRDGSEAGKDIDYERNEITIAANWDAFVDGESGVTRCFVGIGTSRVVDDKVPFVEVSPNVTEYEFVHVALEFGRTFYSLVKCTNGVDLTTVGSSDGVVFDDTPPIAGTVATLQYQSSSSKLEATWKDFRDAESFVDRCAWAIGTEKNHEQVQNFQSVYLNEKAVATGLSLRTDISYIVTVQCVNGARQWASASSDGLIIDMSPPDGGQVYDGAEGDIDWHDSTIGIDSHWSDFSDPESGIVQYKWFLGTYAGGCEVASVLNLPPDSTLYSCQQCVFLAGMRYYITVIAVNGAGLKMSNASDGFVVDLTEPNSGVLSDPKWLTNDWLQFTWTGGDDYESGPPQCVLVAVGSEGTLTQNQLQNSSNQVVFVERTSLPEADVLTLSINCTDRAGLSSASPIIAVDASPPIPGAIYLLYYDALSITIRWDNFYDPDSVLTTMTLRFSTAFFNDSVSTSASDTQYTYHASKAVGVIGNVYDVSASARSAVGLQSPSVVDIFNFSHPQSSLDFNYCCDIELSVPSNTTIRTRWNWRCGLNDESTRLGYRYRYSIGTVPDGSQILDFTDVGIAREALCDDCELIQGAYYYVALHASSDNFQTFSSRQSSPFLIDVTPPVSSGPVQDGLNGDKDYYEFDETFAATWVGVHDPETSIKYCNASVLEKSGGTVLWNMNAIPYASVSGDHLPWTHAHAYRTRFVCVSGGGLSAAKESDGFTVDATPPTVGRVAMAILSEVRLLVNISGTWSGFNDAESRIAFYSWSLVESSETYADKLFVFVGTETSFTATVNLTRGQWYEIVVRATNGAGLQTHGSSPATVYDLTAPIGSFVNDGSMTDDVDYVTSASGFESSWGEMSDPETKIVECFWYVGREPNGSSVLSPRAVAVGAGSGQCDDCVLSSGVRYYSTLSCYNEAGLQGILSSDGVLVDVTPPVAGRVYSGNAQSLRMQYRSNLHVINCSWEAFTDKESGISTYTVCLGKMKGTCDMAVAEGLSSDVSLWTFSGLELVDKEYYFCTVTAQNRAGLNATASSDGVKIDLTKPVAGTVIDSSDGKSSCRSDNATTIATWSHFSDVESGIVEYEWGVGTVAGSDDVLPFDSVGLKESATSNATMPVGMVYVSVRATNGAGLTVVGVSDGKRVYEFGHVPSSCVLFES